MRQRIRPRAASSSLRRCIGSWRIRLYTSIISTTSPKAILGAPSDLINARELARRRRTRENSDWSTDAGVLVRASSGRLSLHKQPSCLANQFCDFERLDKIGNVVFLEESAPFAGL